MINTVVVGGGQAGLALSYFLSLRGIDHVVLERDRAFSAWYGRWDRFCMNTANWMNRLPGCDRPFVVGAGDYGIATKAQALVYFEAYVKGIHPPLREGVAVRCVKEGEGVWTVETNGEMYGANGVVPRVVRVFDVRGDSWIGQRVMRRRQKGDPAMAPAPRILARDYGVGLVGRVVDVCGDALICADGKTVGMDDLTVIWCTGFRPNWNFVQVQKHEEVFGMNGPLHHRGVVPAAPRLFFVGLRFQHTLGSSLLCGVSRDAEYVANRIAAGK